MRARPRLFAAAIAAGGLIAGASLLSSPARAELLIEIDKTTQRMSVTRDGAPLYVWPVSTGRAGHDTPSGAFRPFRMEADHYSKEWDDAPMPHSVFFTKRGHAIHGSFDVKKLGSAASAGCVRLEPKHAATLFQMVKAEGLPNVRVEISGQVQRRAPMDEIARRSPQTGLPQNLDPQEPGQQYQYRDRDGRYPDPYYSSRQRDPRYAQPGYGQGYVYGRPEPRYDAYGYPAQRYRQPRYADPYYDERRYYQRRGYGYGWD